MKKNSYFKIGSGSRKGFVSKFQDKELKETINQNKISKLRNQIITKSSDNMNELIDNCISLTVTSPPYNIGKDSDEDLSDDEYWKMITKVFEEVYRVTESGGRLVVNVANLGRKPYIPFSKYFIEIILEIGFLMRGEIIWQKSKGANANFAWGSWLSPSNPVIRDIHEYCLVFSKDSMKNSTKGEPTIEKEEFMESTLSIWNISPARARKIGHPAPFPVELAKRFINLYSFKNDLILDPFIGSGSTAIAAKLLDRDYIGYELNPEYVEIAKNRLKNETS
jgi:site-specific DNA-methyltransferase (adenine-specific)